MCQRMEDLGRSWELFYSARTRRNAALLDRLQPFGPEKVHLSFDHEPGGTMLDLARIVASKPPDLHFYCCGPIPMLSAFERATASLPPERVHVEYFSARDAPASGGGFTVELARSGRRIAVPAGKTILDALLDGGVAVPSSCKEGVCGSCEVAVLEGVPDHRDLVLSKDERSRNRSMMICCSGSRSERLVLDL
jgi:vanillate O-demethylase ferredoxin subunit